MWSLTLLMPSSGSSHQINSSWQGALPLFYSVLEWRLVCQSVLVYQWYERESESVWPAGCEQGCWSLFPAVPAAAAVEGGAEFATAHAVPGPAARSPLASQGTSGHPTSGSNRNTETLGQHISRRYRRAVFPLNTGFFFVSFLPAEVSSASFMDSSRDWGLICTSSVMFRNDSCSQGSRAPSVKSH